MRFNMIVEVLLRSWLFGRSSWLRLWQLSDRKDWIA